MPPPWGLGKVSKKGMPPSSFGCSLVNFIWGSMEFRYWSILSWLPLGMMLKTSSTYLFQSLTGTGNSGSSARFSKYSIYMLATTGEQGEPIAVLCSCLKNLSWKVKTQFSKTNLRSCITSSFSRPMVLHPEGATIFMLGLRVLNVFTEQPVDDVQGCGNWDAGEECRDIKGH